MNARLRTGIAAGILTAAGIAGWASVSEPGAAKQAVVSPLPDKSTVGPGPAVRAVAEKVSLTDLEQKLTMALAPEPGPFIGDRLDELCAPGVPGSGPGAAYHYAKAWAEKHPEQLFEWVQRGGRLEMKVHNAYCDLTNIIFHSWAAKDPAAAVKGALTCKKNDDRGHAMYYIIEVLRKTDPARAAEVAAQHIGLLSGPFAYCFDASADDYRQTLAFIRALPASKDRDAVLARFFEGVAQNHGKECAQIWNEMPEELRRGMAGAGFKGRHPDVPAALPGLAEWRREHAATGSDPEFMRDWLQNDALDWAERDPAAVVAWTQAHLKGEQRVTATAGLFKAAAATNFEETFRAWQALPDGVLKARAAGNLAAGAPEERKAEVEAMWQSLPPGDVVTANAARKEALSQRQRVRTKIR